MTIAKGIKSLKTKIFGGNLEGAWKDYIQSNPSTGDLVRIFFLNKNGQLNELVWGEIKSRDDIKNDNIADIILHCQTSDQIVQEAWQLLSERSPSERDLDFLTRFLDESHFVSKEIEKRFGTQQGHLLRRVKNLI